MVRLISLVFKMKRLDSMCKILIKTLRPPAQLFREATPYLKLYDNILKIIEFVPSFLYYI